MAIVGHNPESGIRLVLERARDGGPPWSYAGEVFTPSERFVARAAVSADGAVRVVLEGCEDASVADKARFILRAAYKHAQADGDPAPPPRRIVRWRGEK